MALIKALGLDGAHVTHIDLHFDRSAIPTAEVQMYAQMEYGEPLEIIEKHYQLVPLDGE